VFEGARSGADLEPFTLELPGDTTAKCRVRVIPFVERRDSGRLLLVHVAEEFERPGAARAFLEAVARRRAPGRAADARLPVAGLTRRESEVLRLLARGFQSRQVAASLHVSHVTVRNHIESLLAKLGVHSQLEAVAVYLVQQKRCACIGRRGAARPRVPPIRPRRRELPFGAGPQGAHP
jgi:DNA-binding CsgD family transcriptional regulator